MCVGQHYIVINFSIGVILVHLLFKNLVRYVASGVKAMPPFLVALDMQHLLVHLAVFNPFIV